MNDFERALSATLGRDNMNKIQNVKVGIAGAGGLGSNCALFLVRSGFKKIKLVDFDRVEYSNLNRQFYFLHQVGALKVEALKQNLLAINPALEVETVCVRLEADNAASLFQDCDAVVEAFDRAEYKRLVVESNLGTGKLVVAASGLAGWGKSDDIIVRRMKDNFYLIGDLTSEATPQRPPVAPRVNIAAAKQADTVLSYFLDRG